MDPATIAAIIGGGTGVLNTAGNIIATDMTNKANKNLAEYAYQKDLEMWNKQNEYNNPVNQMVRLKAAGLNPHLVYGNGAVGNTTGGIPQYNAPHLQKPDINLDIVPAIQMYNQVRLNEAQVNNIQKQTELSDVQLKNAQIDLANKEWLQNEYIEYTTNVSTDNDKASNVNKKNLVRQALRSGEFQKLKNLDLTDRQIYQLNQMYIHNEKMFPIIQAIEDQKIKQERLKTGAMEFGDTLRAYGIDANSGSLEKFLAHWLDQIIKGNLGSFIKNRQKK